jgi:SpoVK/Ycf46/Vps4 family AAA+-type ATPase
MKNRRPPNQPLSPYDPRYKKMAIFDYSGKMQRPQELHEKQGKDLCSCGDPNCNYDLVNGAGRRTPTISAAEISQQNMGMDEMANVFSSSVNDALVRAMRDQMRDQMMRSFVVSEDASPFRTPDKPSVPASYTSAREAVKSFLLEVNHNTAWDDVIGNDAARSALVEAIEEPKKNPDLYKFYGMTPPKGVLLFGPPGCGKTMFAKAAAAAVGKVYGTKAEVLVVNGPQIQSPYVGVTEEKIRAIFKFAREYRAFHKHPLTVFFDEAEVLFPDRTGRTRKVAPWEESQVAQFLAEMDGLNDLGAFVILATNRPEAIDEALLRDGRCDRKIKVERPTKAAVEHILRKTLSDIPMAAAIDDLVMAGAESFFNPHCVIHEGHLIAGSLSKEGAKLERDVAINFCLEHIVSGAMVVSIGRRAKSRAFARDRDSGKREGIQVMDVVGAVTEIFEENKSLEHAFALREFIEAMPVKEMLEPKGRLQ